MPLTVGTAGHIDHGKTWLVRALTGKDTDRLPEEQRRGISIDLGYAPLELPGRTAALARRRARARALRPRDGGRRDRDRPLPARDRRGRGRAAADARAPRDPAAARRRARRRRGDEGGRGRRRDARARARRRRASSFPAPRSSRSARRRARGSTSFARRSRGPPTALSSADTHGAPHGSTSTVSSRCAGSARSSPGRSGRASIGDGDMLRVEPGGTRGARPLGPGARRAGRARPRRVSGWRSSLPGVERRELRAATRSSRPAPSPSRYRLDVALDELEPIEDGARVTVHHGTGHVPARVVRIGERCAQLRLVDARRRCARRPRRAARRDDGRRRARARSRAAAAPRRARGSSCVERGEIAATIHAPVRVSALRHLLDGELEGVERAGDWVFSSAWLDELRAELRRPHRRCRSARSGHRRCPSEPWAAEIVPLLGLERRGSRLYARRDGRSRLAARPRATAELEQRARRRGIAAVKVEDAELARFLEGKGTLVRLGDGYAVGAGRLRGGARRCSCRVRARRGDLARALPRPRRGRAGAMRSSCSSASTPTGSRAETANVVSCAAGRVRRRGWIRDDQAGVRSPTARRSGSRFADGASGHD